MVKSPRSFWSLRNGFHCSPELRYAIYHANMFPTVFFQCRVLNPHLETTNKNIPTKWGQKQLVKTFLLQRFPGPHWFLTEPTMCCCGGISSTFVAQDSSPEERTNSRVLGGYICPFVRKRKQSGPFPKHEVKSFAKFHQKLQENRVKQHILPKLQTSSQGNSFNQYIHKSQLNQYGIFLSFSQLLEKSKGWENFLLRDN